MVFYAISIYRLIVFHKMDLSTERAPCVLRTLGIGAKICFSSVRCKALS